MLACVDAHHVRFRVASSDKGTLKSCAGQMSLKVSRKLLEALLNMIVADLFSGQLPNMLLWIQVWRARRKAHDRESWILFQKGGDGRTTMPGCSVPQEQNGFVRNRIGNQL